MRYYDIQITDADSGALVKQFTSLNTLGQTILGALNVELDIPVVQLADPMGAAYVRVWGISLQDISQAFNLNGKTITVSAGMAKGLPLANPKQAGLILQGTVTQAFGNWQGVEQTLDFIVNSVTGTAEDPKNLVLTWSAGQTLGDAVRATLAIAFPDYAIEDSTSGDLVLNQDEAGFYQTVGQLADYVKQVSQSIHGGADYGGVRVRVQDKTFYLYDGTTSTAPLQIAFTDLIGQPSWLGLQQINFKTAMRADIQVGDYIQLPQGQVTSSAQSYSQYRDSSAFKGIFQVGRVRHVGNFRQPDANSWVTVFDAYTAATS